VVSLSNHERESIGHHGVMPALRRTTFKELVTLQRGFDLPAQDRVDGAYPVVAATSIRGFHHEYKVEPPGVVIGRSGALGKVQYISTRFWPLNTTLWVKDFKGNFPRYVYYLLQTLELKRFNSGVGVPTLNRNDLDTLEIAIHDQATQRKIAGILSAYDDLIENNRRRMAILQEMAQALYREWFIRFRFPGHEQVKRVASPLGPIPQGWEVKEMAEVAHVIDCLHSQKPKDAGRGGLLLQVWNIAEGGLLDLSKPYRIKAADYKLWTSRIEVSTGDCIVTNVGRIAAVAQIPQGIKAAIGRNMTAIRCKPNLMTPTFLIEYLLSPYMKNEVNLQKDCGTIMDSLNVKGMVKLRVMIPTRAVMRRFEAVARPIRRRGEMAVDQNANLHRMRDLLLPKLVSGEVDVADLDIHCG
jgi:type I restriction enzyme S subunit